MNPRRLLLFLLALVLLQRVPAAHPGAPPARASDAAELRRGFAQPPDAAKLRCYWWWLNGNTTAETITRELTEMHEKGIGGVLLVDANGSDQNGNESVPPGPTFGSPDWVRLYLHALKTASALHMEVTLNITSGWNLGGPEVRPEEASKLLTWSRTQVSGESFDGVLPLPPVKNGFYRQIAVLAYPLAHGVELPRGERPPIRGLGQRSAAAETGFSMPPSEALLDDCAETAGEQDTRLADVIDISGQAGADGRLRWTAPARGPWEILRIGYTDSGARVSTSSGAWQGLAIDYLDRGAFDIYWDRSVRPLLDGARPYLGRTLVNLATDSWELGGTNWTGRFAGEFRRRRGYDPVPYLPVVAGRIVESRGTSSRFLNDLRRTVGDLVTDHYDHFAERARAYGLGVQAESGGPHGAPIDALETFRSSQVPQTEYWAPSREHRTADGERFFTKEAASAADIYGRSLVAQEGMTSIGPQWSESLARDLKPAFDQALTEGMNRLVWHAFTSSPESFGLPGNEYFAGTHLNPRITWWEQSRAFFLYLNREQFLLQQGHAVNDVLYFYGDQVPNFVRLKSDDPARVLPGYDYDVTDEDALLHSLEVRDGAIFSPAGNRYRVVVMPRSGRLSLAALEEMERYVRQGGTVVGPRPASPTGVVPAGTMDRFARLARALWGEECSGRSHEYGAGRVFCQARIDARPALEAAGVRPDFVDDASRLDYVHRSDGIREIYFVRNGGSLPVDTVARFRVAGRAPELWNAVDGSIEPQAFYRAGDGVTALPIHLAPFGSIFVVFERPAGLHVDAVRRNGGPAGPVTVSASITSTAAAGEGAFLLSNAAPGQYTLHLSDGRERTVSVAGGESRELAAPGWTVAFQKGRGAPEAPQSMESFASWSESADPGVRYFSGTATYRTSVDPGTAAMNSRVLLELTELHEICTVRINGRPAGTIWAMPYQLDVTGSLRSGANSIELDVTNLWPNRLIGDAQPAASRTYTRTNIRRYTRDSPLLPSGIIGPVTLKIDPRPVPDIKR